MPLPPIPGAAWLRFRADTWRKQQEEQLDRLREQASVWDLAAQSAVHGIGDTFSGLGTRVQAAQEALPDLPQPAPLPPPLPEPEPQPISFPAPAPPPAPAPSGLQGLTGGIGDTFSGLGTRVRGQAEDWASSAQGLVDGIGSLFAEPPAPDPSLAAAPPPVPLSPAPEPLAPPSPELGAGAPPPGRLGGLGEALGGLASGIGQGVQGLTGGLGQALGTIPDYTPPTLPSLSDLHTRATGFLNTQGDALLDAYRTNILDPTLAGQAEQRTQERQDYDQLIDRIYARNPAAAPPRGSAEREGQLDRMLFAGTVGASAAGGLSVRRPSAAEVADVLSSAPLTAPPSQLANFLSGATRTGERLANELAELRPIDFALDALTTGRTALSPSTFKKAGQAFGSGPTPRNPGPTGAASPTGLASAPGRAAQVLTSGTRANASIDEVVRTANEAGARAVGTRRGLTGQDLEDFVQQAGDYATITGPNSPVANAVNKAKSWAGDPDARPAERAVGWVAAALSPYVSMTERALGATLASVTAPVRVPLQQGAKRLLPSNAVTDALTGQKLTPRQMMGQMAVGTAIDLKLTQLASGQVPGVRIYGPPPEDQGLKKEMERNGARWESLVLGTPGSEDVTVIPLRNFGSVGQAGSLIASLVAAGEEADRGGKAGGEKVERLANEVLAWTLDQSFLSDYANLGESINERRGTRALARTVVGVPGRLASVVAGPANASDPIERETGSMGGALASAVPGGRYLLPEKIDPTTGEGLRRAGSGWTRYWGERGTAQTPVIKELTRLDLTAHDFRTGEYSGEKQTPQVLEKVKRYVGGETGKAVRETMASPEYAKADDAQKKRLLEGALRTADFEAELRLGDTVKRSPRQQADWEYEAVPHYDGAKKGASADDIRRDNHRVREARAARARARKTYPDNPSRGETEWSKTHREQFLLAQRGDADEYTRKKRRAEIDEKYGVTR